MKWKFRRKGWKWKLKGKGGQRLSTCTFSRSTGCRNAGFCSEAVVTCPGVYEHQIRARLGTAAARRSLQRSSPVQIEALSSFVSDMAHIRQSRPDSGLGFQVKVHKIFRVFPSLLGSGFPKRFSARTTKRFLEGSPTGVPRS